MDPLYSSFIGALARWAVTLAIGFLVAHHIIAVDQTTYFVEGFTHKLVIALPLLLPLAWSLWNKYRGRVKFLTALESPAGTTEAGVVAKIENGMGASVKAVAILLACGIGGAGLQACGPKQYHTAVIANTSIAQAIFAVQDAEIAAHNAKLVTDVKHAAYKAEILKLLEAGDDLTLALKDWNQSQPVPANVGLAIGKVQQLLTDLQINSPQASALLYTVQTVLSLLRGTGVLPGKAADAVRRDDLVTDDSEVAIQIIPARLATDDAAGDFGAVVIDDDASIVVRDRRAIQDHAAVARLVDRAAEAERDLATFLVSHVDHALILLPEVARG